MAADSVDDNGSRLSGGEGPLTAREIEVLAFAGIAWKWTGAQESAVRATFDWSMPRYFQVLNALIDRPEALAHDPLLVNRLRRLRATRSTHRREASGQDSGA